MTVNSAATAEILHEVFRGTGGTLTDESDPYRSDHCHPGLDYLTAVSIGSRRSVLTVTSLASGAFLVALGALIVSYYTLEERASLQRMRQDIDMILPKMPILKGKTDAVADDVALLRAEQQPVLQVVNTIGESLKMARSEFHQSIDEVNARLAGALDAVRTQQDEVKRRLAKVEIDQTAQASELKSLQLRMTTSDFAIGEASSSKAATLADFHLQSIKKGVAMVVGPDGPRAVSVGDTLFDHGKVLKIEGSGQNGALVTEQGTLKITWPHHFGKTKRTSGALWMAPKRRGEVG